MADPISISTEAANAASVLSAFCSTDVLPWLQALLVPLVIVVTAYLAWRVQRDVLARRTAFDYIFTHELAQDWIDLSATALKQLAARPKKDDWAAIATAWSQAKFSEEDIKLTTPIFHWLNRREFLSIGLLNGSVHQPTYAEWWGFNLIGEWERAEPFVRAFRSTDRGDDGFFCKFEELATSDTFRQLSGWTPANSIQANIA